MPLSIRGFSSVYDHSLAVGTEPNTLRLIRYNWWKQSQVHIGLFGVILWPAKKEHKFEALTHLVLHLNEAIIKTWIWKQLRATLQYHFICLQMLITLFQHIVACQGQEWKMFTLWWWWCIMELDCIAHLQSGKILTWDSLTFAVMSGSAHVFSSGFSPSTVWS